MGMGIVGIRIGTDRMGIGIGIGIKMGIGIWLGIVKGWGWVGDWDQDGMGWDRGTHC